MKEVDVCAEADRERERERARARANQKTCDLTRLTSEPLLKVTLFIFCLAERIDSGNCN